MKKFLFLIWFVFSFTMNAQAPYLQWQKTLGGTLNDNVVSIQLTNDGGFIVVGNTSSNDGDVSGNHGSDDAWVVKLNISGTIEWQKTLGGTLNDNAISIQQTTDGEYIIAGFTTSNDGDVSGNHGGVDAWVVKLSTTGTIQWQKTLGGTGNDQARNIQQTTDGGFVTVGTTNSNDGDVSGNHGGNDYWVVKLDNMGNIQWQKTLGGSFDDVAYNLIQTTDGGYIVVGFTTSNNGDVTGNHGGVFNDAWVVKLSTTGTIQWQKTLGGTGYDQARNIQQTTDGGFVIVGNTDSNDGDVTGYFGSDDAWVVKLSTTGTIQWQKTLGGTCYDQARNIQQTADGGYVTIGYTDGNDCGIADAWVVKLSTTGTIQWQKTLGGTGYEEANSIHQTADGGYIIAGLTGSIDGDVSGNHGGYDAWVVKLSSEQLSTPDFSTSVLKLYPNPTHYLINIQTSNHVVLDKISITDLMGKTVIEQTQNTNQVSVEKLATGVYILNGYSEGNKFQNKFIKE